ncbi:hypothetical protein BDA99DRAFT_531431 [Phascolomyces articulosus]|uniref:Uncharacterized protein n=1 Tax=Phascolomyces articulosus TaxID=60185 RepID=A0AAD5PJF0_9FUNG|nr:hypothetical protein BDA99DRAFT_531431 [Phascolomyces articulosus]
MENSTSQIGRRHRNGHCADIEEAIYLWILECENRNIPLNWKAITTAGSKFATKLAISSTKEFMKKYFLMMDVLFMVSTLMTASLMNLLLLPLNMLLNHPLTDDEIVALVKQSEISQEANKNDEVIERVQEMPIKERIVMLNSVLTILDEEEYHNVKKQLRALRDNLTRRTHSLQSILNDYFL